MNRDDLGDFEFGVWVQFIKNGLVSIEEAKTLPAVEDLAAAYHACAIELSQKAAKQVQALQTAVALITEPEKMGEGLIERGLDYFALASTFYWEAYALYNLTEAGKETYVNDLIELMQFRRGIMLEPLIVDRNEKESLYEPFGYASLFVHLPERSIMPFANQIISPPAPENK